MSSMAARVGSHQHTTQLLPTTCQTHRLQNQRHTPLQVHLAAASLFTLCVQACNCHKLITSTQRTTAHPLAMQSAHQQPSTSLF